MPKEPWQPGGHCNYRRVTEGWGIKLYRNQQRRDHCFRLCEIAADAGMAPRVRLKFTRGNWYGFAIEHCKQLPVTTEQVAAIECGLANIISEVRDIYPHNVGWLDGRLVCFDFSECQD